MFDIMSIARYVIQSCCDYHVVLDQYELQAALYFIQANFLVNKGEGAFVDNALAQFWGVNFLRVSDSFCIYASNPIFKGPNYTIDFKPTFGDLRLIDDIIKQVVEIKQGSQRTNLQEMIKNTQPYHNAVCGDRGIVDKNDIIKYYTDALSRAVD